MLATRILSLRRLFKFACVSALALMPIAYLNMSRNELSYWLKWQMRSAHQQMESILRSKAHDNAVMVVQVKGDAVELAKNFICSLSNVLPNAVDDATQANDYFVVGQTERLDLSARVVFWAYDGSTYAKLKQWQHAHQLQYSTKEVFGVIFDSDAQLAWTSTSDAIDIYDMMQDRPRFIANVLRMGLDLMFADADAVFFRDPWHWLVSNKGMGVDFHTASLNDTLASWQAVGGYNTTTGEHQRVLQADYRLLTAPEADIVYSTDGGDFYSEVNDPLQGGNSVPKICMGLFLARSSHRTIHLFERLKAVIANFRRYNDQYGIDLLFNSEMVKDNEFGGVENVLVGKLPRCLGRWRGMPRRNCDVYDLQMQSRATADYDMKLWPSWMSDRVVDAENYTRHNNGILRVRVVDQIQVTNGEIQKAKYENNDFASANQFAQVLHKSTGIESYVYRNANYTPLPDFQVHGQDTVDAPKRIAISLHANTQVHPHLKTKPLNLNELGAWLLDERGMCRVFGVR